MQPTEAYSEPRQAHHLLLPALPDERQQRPHHKVRAQDIHRHDVLEILNIPACMLQPPGGLHHVLHVAVRQQGS